MDTRRMTRENRQSTNSPVLATHNQRINPKFTGNYNLVDRIARILPVCWEPIDCVDSVPYNVSSIRRRWKLHKFTNPSLFSLRSPITSVIRAHHGIQIAHNITRRNSNEKRSSFLYLGQNLAAEILLKTDSCVKRGYLVVAISNNPTSDRRWHLLGFPEYKKTQRHKRDLSRVP